MTFARTLLTGIGICATLVACERRPPVAGAIDTSTLALDAASAPTNELRTFRYSRAIDVAPRPGYTLLTIDPGAQHRWRFRYALRPRGTTPVVAEEDAAVIDVPVRSVTVEISNGTQQYIDDLGMSDAVIGISGRQGVYPWLERLHQRLRDGKVHEVGGGDLERLLEVKPDLVLSDFTGGNASLWAIHRRTNLTAIALAVRMERHPLASAEWIKVLGLLFDRNAPADALFAGIEARYRDLAARAHAVRERPRVLPMRMAADQWQDRDVIRQIVVDAGGQPVPRAPDVWRYYYDYPYEVILDQGANADIWPFARPWWSSTSAMTAEDARLAAFRPVREGRVYHPNGRMQPRLVDPYFSALYLYPDRVLADLVHLFHPEVLPNHQLYYFRHIKDTTG